MGVHADKRSLTGTARLPLGWGALLLGVLFLVGAALKPVASHRQPVIEVSPQYGATAITLYFTDADQRYLIPISRRTSEENVTDPRRAVEELLRGPIAGPELRSLFLPGTRVLSFEVQGEAARLDVSGPAFAAGWEARAVQALVLTLTEFPGIKHIELFVEGQPIGAEGLPAVGVTPLARPPAINPEAGAAGDKRLTLYFAYGQVDRYLVPVSRPISPERDRLAASMEELLRGPQPGSDLTSVIPPDVYLRSIRLEDGVAYIDLSEELIFAYRLKQARPLEVRRAVIATLTELPAVYAALIEIGGSSLLYYSCQNVYMERPQARPWAINDEFYLTALDAP